jgi:hypothetical protein
MRAVVWGLFCLGLAACRSTSPSAPTTPLSVRVVVAQGETVDVDGAAMRLRFEGVTGDSRCPADVVCIQGGDAIVRIEVQSTTLGPTFYDLHTGNMLPVRHREVTIALVDLSPYPFSNRTIGNNEYRATFQITR